MLPLLRLRWQRRRAGSTRLLLRGTAYVLIGVFVGFMVGWIGLVFPETLAKNGVERPPHRVLDAHLLSVCAALVLVRVVLQRAIGSGWRPFLALPVVLAAVAATGLASLGAAPLWLPRMETALRRRRHALLRGFRGPWLSPTEWHW